MKKKISICIEESTIDILEKKVQTGTYRSRSHLVERALADYLTKTMEENHGNRH